MLKSEIEYKEIDEIKKDPEVRKSLFTIFLNI